MLGSQGLMETRVHSVRQASIRLRGGLLFVAIVGWVNSRQVWAQQQNLRVTVADRANIRQHWLPLEKAHASNVQEIQIHLQVVDRRYRVLVMLAFGWTKERVRSVRLEHTKQRMGTRYALLALTTPSRLRVVQQ